MQVLALSWPHTRVWTTGAGSRVLVQNTSGSRTTVEHGGGLVARTRRFREQGEALSPGVESLALARSARPDAHRSLLDEPLVRASAVRASQRRAPSDFDNRIHLRPGVAVSFARLHALMRPYILQH
ncbi:MAG: hypothetical protein INH41_01565 [Myxococcaceae bacterium]|jgi:hypothetical protein|nr:hypothetical protein [Myxococcaceae bacterium]MCA3011067.1 hypothetical protein [Myxococcaceae bacterium]